MLSMSEMTSDFMTSLQSFIGFFLQVTVKGLHKSVTKVVLLSSGPVFSTLLKTFSTCNSLLVQEGELPAEDDGFAANAAAPGPGAAILQTEHAWPVTGERPREGRKERKGGLCKERQISAV